MAVFLPSGFDRTNPAIGTFTRMIGLRDACSTADLKNGSLYDDFNNTCKESVADCNANDVEKDEKNLEELVAAKRHQRLCGQTLWRDN